MKMFTLTLVCLSVFCINAFADERQQILDYTLLNSPHCAGLRIRVPNEIVKGDGIVDADAAIGFNENIDEQAKVKNCLGEVNNAIVNYNNEKKISEDVMTQISNSASKFMLFLAAGAQASLPKKISGADASVGTGRRW